MTVDLRLGDCLEVMASMPENSVDSIVCDPPYELGFMGKAWDRNGVAFQIKTWQAALRVAKPGAILMAFGGTRTWHRLACALEDAGWEIRDTLMYLYGVGFPKSRTLARRLTRAKARSGKWWGWPAIIAGAVAIRKGTVLSNRQWLIRHLSPPPPRPLPLSGTAGEAH